MKKDRKKGQELAPVDNHMTMSVQHDDRFSRPQVKN